MRRLNFETTFHKFVFIYNNSSTNVSEEEKKFNIQYFLKEVVWSYHEDQIKHASLTLTCGLDFGMVETELEKFRKMVLPDEDGAHSTFNIPSLTTLNEKGMYIF